MRIFLRALELSDIEQLVKWRNDIEVTTLLGGNTFFVSKFREIEWLKNAILHNENNKRLAICLKDSERFIGNINLTSINWINRSAEYYIMIGEKDTWGKGYGFEASILILKYAFNELNLNRIFLTVREDNINAIKLYKKIGFKEEGLLRQQVYNNNKYINMIIMSILKDEFSNEI